jgi:hypothetical protein
LLAACLALPAPRMGNPAADPLVIHLSFVVLVLELLPSRSGRIRHVRRRHQLAVPTHLCPEGARHSCVDRCPPASWAVASQCGCDACRPLPAPKGAILPMSIRNRVQRDPNQASHAATANRDRLRRRHRGRSRGAMRFRFVRRCPGGVPVLVSAPGGFAGLLDHRMFAPSGPQPVPRPGRRPWPTGLAVPMTRAPHAERLIPCR